MEYDALNKAIAEKIEAIFEKAWNAGRKNLHEHEVYGILDLLEMETPYYRAVSESSEITVDLVNRFPGDRVVMKIISPDIYHKAKVGGVKIAHRNVDFVRYMYEKMVAEVGENVEGAKIEGVLIAEYVDYSKDLGNETLISCKESFSFGPVVSFSKGGSDAEHFAKHFSSPNLQLAPFRLEEAGGLINSTSIYTKYIQEDHTDYPERISETLYKFGKLASTFSSFNPLKRPYILTEFEVNPFVFDYAGRYIALDGLGIIEKNDTEYTVESDPNITNLDAFLKPDGVAVIGVSASDPGKMGNRIARLLVENGRDDLYFVNIRGGEVEFEDKRYPLYKSLTEIGKPVELVVVTVPADFSVPVIKEARETGVKGVILIPGGFSELGDEKGSTLEKQVIEAREGSDLRIVGPNCVGVFYSGDDESLPLNTIFIPRERLEFIPKQTRNVALITQSGAMGISEVDKLKHAIYPRFLISYGNQIDVDPGDLIAYFDKDPSVDVIALYIEGFKPFGGREFFNVARNLSKPIIAYKAGRTDAGSRAAASHTASMTGDYETARSAFVQAGVVVTDTILDHKDLVMTFALLYDKNIIKAGKRVAGVVNAGFEGTYAADTMGDLELAAFSEATSKKLRKMLPPIVSVNPILDLTPMADDELFADCIEAAIEDENVDCVFVSIVPHTAQLRTGLENLDDFRANIADRIVEMRGRFDKPIVVSVNAGTMYNHLGEILANGGVPAYTTAERAMFCLNRFIEYNRKRK